MKIRQVRQTRIKSSQSRDAHRGVPGFKRQLEALRQWLVRVRTPSGEGVPDSNRYFGVTVARSSLEGRPDSNGVRLAARGVTPVGVTPGFQHLAVDQNAGHGRTGETMGQEKKRLDSDKVLEFAKEKTNFSTDQVARKFKVPRQQAAAAIAILRLKSLLERGEPKTAADGSSAWKTV
jgi:hypothetical protein